MTASPPVAIGVPVYNGAPFLATELDSLLAQSFTDFAIVICDNASTDATEEICRDYAARDSRVTYHRNAKNLGASANFNLTFERSSSEYFKWASADDVHDPEFLTACMDAMKPEPLVSLVYPRTLLIDVDGTPIGPYDDNLDLRATDPSARLRKFAQNWSLGNPSMGLVRRSAMNRTGLLRPHAGSDILLLGELALRGKILELPQRLFLRRIHGGTSRRANVTRHEVAAWFDPSSRAGPRFSGRTIIYLKMLQIIATSDALPLYRRPGCGVTFSAAWWQRRARVRLGRLRQRLQGATPSHG